MNERRNAKQQAVGEAAAGNAKADKGAVWLISPDALATYNRDGAVVLDIPKGICYSLNATASRIWFAMESSPSGITLEGIVGAIETHFEIPHQELEADTADCLDKLERMGLLQANGHGRGGTAAVDAARRRVGVQELIDPRPQFGVAGTGMAIAQAGTGGGSTGGGSVSPGAAAPGGAARTAPAAPGAPNSALPGQPAPGVANTPVDPGRTILRIDLRDFEWKETVWEQILADYPYRVIEPGASAGLPSPASRASGLGAPGTEATQAGRPASGREPFGSPA